ncbi:MAG: MFS transporter [Thalassobaculum sp.]|uniref:MFS transporter n=1 Tax=Thalassobaculum sp. TaxID=2022740 RepID=UPI0032EF9F2D
MTSSPSAADGAPAPRSHLFAIPDFRRLWLAGLTSFVVRWLEMLAVGVFAYQATGSAFLVAMLTMLRLLPMGLFGAPLGAFAERMERRSALIVIMASMMATSAAIAVLAGLDRLEVWHLAVAGFLNGLCWAADNPVRRMMIGDAVGPERMGPAMSLDVGANNASRMLGPTVGGLILATLGIAGVFWLGAALYAVGLVASLRIGTRSRPAAADAVSVLTRMREGLAWVRGDRRMTGVLLVTVIFNVFGWPSTSMIPVLGKDELLLGPEGVGLLAGVDGVGAFVGALVIAWLTRPEWYARIYLGGISLYLASMIAFAALPAIAGPVPELAAAALLTCGIGGAGFSVMQATLVYLHSPAEMRGRLLGLLSVCIGVGPIGFFYLGFMAEAFGAQAATVALAAQGLAALALTARWWRAVF